MLRFTAIRYADAADLELIEDIERAADIRFATLSAARGISYDEWPGPGASAAERASGPGFLLVAGQPAVGFAHVLDVAGHLVLEQLSVRPEVGRLGLGTALLRAAMGAAVDAGHDAIFLRTFAEVGWNAPFYTARGFAEVTDPGWLAPLIAAEERDGLSRWGRRITMARPLREEPLPRPAVSVIPLRDGAAGLEAFVQYRVGTMDFAANAVVFPGGRIDAADRLARVDVSDELLREHVSAWRATDVGSVADDAVSAARTLLATGLREVREEAAAELDPSRLVPWDNWVTPIGVPKRFDVYFFIAPVSAGEEASWRHTTTEAHDSHWVRVVDLAAAAESGEALLLPPTRTIVDELASLGDLAPVLALRPVIRPVRHDLDVRRPRPSR